MGNWSTEHMKARAICPPGPCEVCAAPDAEVHHKNEDWHDHSPDNLQRLCRGCHLKAHRGGKKCMLCDQPHKGLGYCETHYQRFKKWGDPAIVKDNQFTAARKDTESNPVTVCKMQGCDSKNHARGFCQKHAQQDRRGTLGTTSASKAEAMQRAWITRRMR